MICAQTQAALYCSVPESLITRTPSAPLHTHSHTHTHPFLPSYTNTCTHNLAPQFIDGLENKESILKDIKYKNGFCGGSCKTEPTKTCEVTAPRTCAVCRKIGSLPYPGSLKKDLVTKFRSWKKSDKSLCLTNDCGGKDLQVTVYVWKLKGHPDTVPLRYWMPTDVASQWEDPAYCLERTDHPGYGWGNAIQPLGMSMQVQRTQKYIDSFQMKCRDTEWSPCSTPCGSGGTQYRCVFLLR